MRNKAGRAASRHASPSHFYLLFFALIDTGGFPDWAFAVARTFGFTCLGFLTSRLPRLLSPLDMVLSSDVRQGWRLVSAHCLPRVNH